MPLTPAGGARGRRVRSLAIGRRESQHCRGITAAKATHNASNVRVVTVSKMAHNSSKEKAEEEE